MLVKILMIEVKELIFIFEFLENDHFFSDSLSRKRKKRNQLVLRKGNFCVAKMTKLNSKPKTTP